MSRALVKRSLLQKQRQQLMKRQREMLKHFANPSSFFNHQSLFIDEFFNDDDFLTPRGVFKTDPFFSRMKRAFDGEPEEEREVKRPKAKIMSQQPDEEKQEDDVEMKTNDEIIVEETKEEEEEEKEMFEPYHRSYSYHTSSITNNGETKTYTKRLYQDHNGHEYEVEEKILPNGHALIYEKEIEDKKIIKESHTVRKKNNHLLETKDVEEDEQAISNFNKEWEQLLNTENTSKKAIENGEASNKNTEN